MLLTSAEAASVGAIMGALALGAMSPGPSFVLVARAAAAQGRGVGVRVACGLGLGGAVFGVVALLGLVSLLEEVAWAGRLLRVGGGAYLLWLAWRMWRGSADSTEASRGATAPPPVLAAPLRTGLITQVANPKTAVVYAGVFAALLPGHVSPGCAIAVVAGVLVVELGWYATVATAFSAHRVRSAYAVAARWIDRAAAVVVAGLGLRLMCDPG